MTSDVIFDGERNMSTSMAKGIIVLTSPQSCSEDISKMIKDGKINSVEYVTTSGTMFQEFVSFPVSPDPIEDDEINEKIKAKKKIDNKNWLKASDKPWERNKKGMFK